jgi:hypothetical protein
VNVLKRSYGYVYSNEEIKVLATKVEEAGYILVDEGNKFSVTKEESVKKTVKEVASVGVPSEMQIGGSVESPSTNMEVM